MSSTDNSSEMNEKNPTDKDPHNATNSGDRDASRPQTHSHANAQQESAFIPPAAPPLPHLLLLTDLKDQSALIQCPHCLRYVYTKLSCRGNFGEYVTIYC
ncbi:hypothetical protein MBANPS3_012441, partial [Mucor bainieri]